MKTAKDQYTEEKKAYDNRTPQEIEAANAAAAAAASVSLPIRCRSCYSRPGTHYACSIQLAQKGKFKASWSETLCYSRSGS